MSDLHETMIGLGPVNPHAPNGHAAEPEIRRRYTYDHRVYAIPQTDSAELLLPSVTSILGEVKVGYGLEGWKAEQAASLGAEGARLDMALRAANGTLVHEAIERLLKGETLEWDRYRQSYSDDAPWKRINRFVSWFQDTLPEVLATEQTVYSLEHGYAGTLDAVMRIDGELVVLDWKTSAAVDRTHELQVVAYAHAYNEMYPQVTGGAVPMAAVLALNTRHKAGYHCKYVEDEPRAWREFLNRKRVFDDAYPEFNPKRDLLPEIVTLRDYIIPAIVDGEELL